MDTRTTSGGLDTHLPTVTIGDLQVSTVQAKIHPRLLALINPTVLTDVMNRITQREQAEVTDSRNYERYLSAHADQIISEVAKRDHGKQAPSHAGEGTRAAAATRISSHPVHA